MTRRRVMGALASLLFAATPVLGAGDPGVIHKDSADASVVRGLIVFNTYCVLCHGARGEGNGRAARLYNPPPANLVSSQYNDDYKELIIRRGGEGVGRSAFMPPWGQQLTDEQIKDLVFYLRSIKRP